MDSCKGEEKQKYNSDTGAGEMAVCEVLAGFLYKHKDLCLIPGCDDKHL